MRTTPAVFPCPNRSKIGTTVYIRKDQEDWLRKQAAARRCSLAEIARFAILFYQREMDKDMIE